MLNPKRAHFMTPHRTEPGQGFGVAIDQGDNAGIARYLPQQILDMA
jgi:hypothetical protein